MRDNKGLSFNLNLNKYYDAYVINDESKDEGRYKDLEQWASQAEGMAQDYRKALLEDALNQALEYCQRVVRDDILKNSKVTFTTTKNKNSSKPTENSLEEFIKNASSFSSGISGIHINYKKSENLEIGESIAAIEGLTATKTTKEIFKKALNNIASEQYTSFFASLPPTSPQLATTDGTSTSISGTNEVTKLIFEALISSLKRSSSNEEKIQEYFRSRVNQFKDLRKENNLNPEVRKYFSTHGYFFIKRIINKESNQTLKLSDWKILLEKDVFNQGVLEQYITNGSEEHVKYCDLQYVDDQQKKSILDAVNEYFLSIFTPKASSSKAISKKKKHKFLKDLALEITKNLVSESKNDEELSGDEILEKVAEVWVGLAQRKVEEIQTALGLPTIEKTNETSTNLDEEEKRKQQKPTPTKETANYNPVELVKIVGIQALIAEINHNIPTLFEEQKQDIVEQLAYLTEIDQIQKDGVTSNNITYALKNPSLEKFESAFFSDEFVKETLLKENGKNRFLSADQFRIVKDFEAALFDIAYPGESSHRKPFVDLDTGEGKTFSIELLKKISDKILSISTKADLSQEIKKIAQDETQFKNLKNLVASFRGIVPINLANQSELDSIQSPRGKIIIIDESRFIPEIERKMKNLVHLGAKVIRVGASQNPAIVLASKFRQEAKLQEIADEEGESDKKKNLKGKIDESERRYAKMLERRAKAESDLQLVSNTSFTNTASDQANSEICAPQNWGEIGWKTSGKEQAQSNAQYLLINKAFDSDQNQEALGRQLREFARNSNVDFAVVNFVKDNKHACLVFQKGQIADRDSVTPYWLEPNQDSGSQSFGEEKSADQKNPKTYEEFKRLSEEILEQQKSKNLKIATIYAGSPNFTVGGDYGTISILGKNNPQEIVIAPDQNLTFDHLKQALGRNRQTDPETLSKRQIHVYAPEESMQKFLKKIENQTFEQDLLELLEFFNSKAELAVESHSKQAHTKPNLDQIYQRIISGKELYNPKNKKYTDIGELGLDQNNEELFSVNRALINQGFFNTAFSKDENGKLFFNYTKTLEELKKKTGKENEHSLTDLKSFVNSEETIPVSAISDTKGFLEHLLKISTPSYGKNTLDELKKESQIKAQSEKEALEERLGEMETSLRQVENEKNSLLAELEELQNQNNESISLVSQTKALYDKLFKTLEQEKAASQELTSENQELLGKISELTSEKEDLERASSEIRKLAIEENNNYKTQLEEATSQVSELEDKVKSLEKRTESDKQHIESLGQTGEKKATENQVMSKKIEELEAEIEAFKKSNKELEKQLKEEKAKAEQIRIRIDNTESELVLTKQQVSNLTEQNGLIKDQALQINDENSRLKITLESKESNILALQQKIETLESDIVSDNNLEQKMLDFTEAVETPEEEARGNNGNKPDWKQESDSLGFEVDAKALDEDEYEYVLKVSSEDTGQKTVKPILFNPSKQEERSDKFRFLKIDEKGKGEIDEESESEINGEENLDTKAKELIKLVVKSTIKDFEEKKIPHKDFIFFIEAIIKAKDQGQSLSKYADTTEGGDKQLLKAFSAQLQKNMAANGIFSGRTKGLREDKLVGLRSHFIAEEILKELKAESQETETKTPNSEVRARESEVKSFLQAKAKIEVAKS